MGLNIKVILLTFISRKLANNTLVSAIILGII